MRIEPITLPLPRGCMGVPPKQVRGPCAMGLDQRLGSWDVAIGHVARREADSFVAVLDFYGKVRDENDAIWLAHQYPVCCGLIDSRPAGEVAVRAVNRLRKGMKDFWRAQYNTYPSNVEMQVNEKEHLLTLERTITMDEVFFRVSSGQGLALPENFNAICGGDFAKEFCEPTRENVEWHGEEAGRWTDNGRDHPFHAVNLMVVAMKVGKLWLAGSSVHAARGRVAASGGPPRYGGGGQSVPDAYGEPGGYGGGGALGGDAFTSGGADDDVDDWGWDPAARKAAGPRPRTNGPARRSTFEA